MSPPRVLVAGGSGFIGRHICRAFADAGHLVLSAARRPAPPQPGVEPVTLDLTGPGVPGVLRAAAPDVVVNAAGMVWDLADDGLRTSNVDLVAALTAAVGRHAPEAVLVHLGSSFEYGPQAPDLPVREDAVARPASGYGRSKLAGTCTVLAASERSGLRAVVLRLTSVVGPGQPVQSLLGRVARELAAAREISDEVPVLQFGPLGHERDFVDVRDVAAAVRAAAAAPGALGRVVNVGSGVVLSHRHLVRRLAEVAGVPAAVVERERRQGGGSSRSTGITRQVLDLTAAADLLGWAATRPLDTTLRDLWRSASSDVRGLHQSLTRR